MRTAGPPHVGAVALITAYVVVAGAAVVALVASGVATATVVVTAAVALVGLVGLLVRVLGRGSAAARRLASDVAVMVDANPSYRLDDSGTGDLAPVAAEVNRLADHRETVVRGAEQQARAARLDMESERNRLAALMARLTVAVVVCNHEGRVLLYNDAARALGGDEMPLGLGRSVFSVVDRGLVTHAYERLSAGRSVYTATTLRHDRLIRVDVALAREPEGGTDAGFVLVLEDLTREMAAGDERERTLRRLTEVTRASLGSMRAAVESVLEFPDLSETEREGFLEIVRDEADRLGRHVEDLASGSGPAPEGRLLADMAGVDLVAVVRSQLEQAGFEVSGLPAPDGLWLRADAHALARAVLHLVSRLVAGTGAGPLTLVLTSTARHGQLDVRWRGWPPSVTAVEAWLDEPLEGGATVTARDVVDRHAAEVWCGELDTGDAYLRLLLPLAADVPASPPASAEVSSRPAFYDFDLFTTSDQPALLADKRLDQMAFTVLDTETTGLDPAGGDRIVSLGAVRVLNGRVLRHETFERLVQPERPVPASSTAIHGITDELLEGAPTIAEVLPAFARFAEDTVLVGHNVAFDLRFLRDAEAGAGTTLGQPALDTFLLHAALHPDHEHTLEAVADRLGVSVVGRHTALGDALVTAEVFVGLLSLLRHRGVHTLGEALAVSREAVQSAQG